MLEQVDAVQVTILVTICSFFASILGYGVRITRYLNDKFNQVTDKLMSLVDEHEEKDQRRHEDNITRFATVETKLNIIMKNGH